MTIAPLFLLAWATAASLQAPDEAALRAELAQVFKALETGDIQFFEGHYVPEVTRIHLGGGVDSGWDANKSLAVKQSFDSGWCMKTSSYEIADLRIYGDIALTAGTASASQTRDGRAEDLSFRFSYVWIRKDGRWKELHHHVSRGN